MNNNTKSFVIVKCLKSAPEYFSGLDVASGAPRWSDKVECAQLWDSRLHAQAQALLLIRHGEVGVQRKAVNVLTAVLGEALR
jgi:hypothetical protein